MATTTSLALHPYWTSPTIKTRNPFKNWNSPPVPLIGKDKYPQSWAGVRNDLLEYSFMAAWWTFHWRLRWCYIHNWSKGYGLGRAECRGGRRGTEKFEFWCVCVAGMCSRDNTTHSIMYTNFDDDIFAGCAEFVFTISSSDLRKGAGGGARSKMVTMKMIWWMWLWWPRLGIGRAWQSRGKWFMVENEADETNYGYVHV